MKYCSFIFIIIFNLFFLSSNAQTVVTTYVTKVQEERQSTRWTLTEWLRIKERMRLMDVWLAMFSDPKKDRFKPELSLTGGAYQGAALVEGYAHESSVDGVVTAGQFGRGQLWLTNIVSSQVGIRALNIDLGGEIYARKIATEPVEISSQLAQNLQLETPVIAARSSLLQYYTGNLRIFGKNIQDSSLILKYGEWQIDQWPIHQGGVEDLTFRGRVYGGELQLYIAAWLGLEVQYLNFADAQRQQYRLAGSFYEYGPYIEISLLRFHGGIYNRQFDYTLADGSTLTEQETGVFYGLKLQL